MRFHQFGLTFEYPENWSVDTGDSAGRHATVTVYTPEGGFWSVSAHAPGPAPQQLTDAVVAQMRQEYQDLDVEPARESVAGKQLLGHDFNFYCLDLTNTAQVRLLVEPQAVYLLLCQAEDREWEAVSQVFAAMTRSFVQSLPPSADGGP